MQCMHKGTVRGELVSSQDSPTALSVGCPSLFPFHQFAVPHLGSDGQEVQDSHLRLGPSVFVLSCKPRLKNQLWSPLVAGGNWGQTLASCMQAGRRVPGNFPGLSSSLDQGLEPLSYWAKFLASRKESGSRKWLGQAQKPTASLLCLSNSVMNTQTCPIYWLCHHCGTAPVPTQSLHH